MAIFSYNGIVATLVKTEGVTREAVYTDDGVDYRWTKFTITIQCVYNPRATSYAGTPPVASPGQPAVVTDVAVRLALMQKRGALNMTVLGIPLVNSGGAGTVDANNGPTPIACNIIKIGGDSTFHISYTIETCINECGLSSFGTQDQPPALLANRFSQTSAFNEQHLERKTSTGIAYFRTDILTQNGVPADAFRGILLPPIEYGFQRMEATFSLHPTGNAIEWTCIDQERMVSLGSTDARAGGGPGFQGTGIVQIHATYAQSSIPMGFTIQPMSQARVAVEAFGNKYTNNYNLLIGCFLVVYSRFPRGGFNGFISGIELEETLTDRHVRLSVQVRLAAAPQGVPGAGSLDLRNFKNINTFPTNQDPNALKGINPLIPNAGGTRGSALGRLQSALSQAACAPVTPISSLMGVGGDAATTPDVYAGPPPAIKFQINNNIGSVPTNIQAVPASAGGGASPGSANSTYTNYSIHTYYSKDQGVLQLPVSATTGPSEVCQVVAPSSVKHVYWRAARAGAYPLIPSPVPNNPNFTLQHSDIAVQNVGLTVDGVTNVYVVDGLYSYVSSNPMGAGDNIPFDVAPWTSYTPGQFALSSSESYSDQILS